jgi:hypothetical protein
MPLRLTGASSSELHAALSQLLGVALDPTTAPIDMVVVDPFDKKLKYSSQECSTPLRPAFEALREQYSRISAPCFFVNPRCPVADCSSSALRQRARMIPFGAFSAEASSTCPL